MSNVARESTMLEAVVQQVQLRAEFPLGELPGLVTLLAHNDRHAQLARNQQRLVSKFARRALGIDERHSSRGAPVPAREHIERDAALLQ